MVPSQKLGGQGSGAPQAAASSWRALAMRSSTIIRSQCCWVKKSANMPDLGCTPSVSLRRAWAEVCRWITSLASGSSSSCCCCCCKVWGPCGTHHPLRHKLRENGAQQCPRVSEWNYRSLPVRAQRKMMSVMRAYEEDVLDEG